MIVSVRFSTRDHCYVLTCKFVLLSIKRECLSRPGGECHAMRECRLCLWTASQSSPFRLDFDEAYFNISRSPEMLVPLSGEWHCDTGAVPCLDPNGYRSNCCEPYRTKVGLSAKLFWHIAKRSVMTNQKPSRPSARNVPMTELMTSRL